MDSIKQVKRSVMLQSWKSMYDEYKSSGMTMRSWCRQNNIPVSTFTYRLRELRAEALLELQDRCEAALPAVSPSVSTFKAPPQVINLAQVQLQSPASSQVNAIRVRHGDTELEIGSGIPEGHLRVILEVILHA